MSRAISANLLSHLASGTLTVCTCLRIVRKDGTKLGFTTLDEGFTYEFITTPDSYGPIYYSPIGSFSPSTIRTTSDTSVDNLEIEGAMNLGLIEEKDLIGGRYDDADVTIFAVNFNAFGDGELIKFRGFIGEITKDSGVYKIELLSARSRLKRNIGAITSPTCRVKEFGDNQCKYNVASVTHTTTVNSLDSDGIRINLNFGSGYFNSGIVEFTSGENAGLRREIKVSVQLLGVNRLELKEPFPFPVTAGDNVKVSKGCDRKLATCKGYGNANNFRGEPFLPGNDVFIKAGRAPNDK